MKYVDLTTVNDVYQAHMLSAALEEAGIPCIEANENTATLLPYLQQGIQIRVRDTDYLRAKVISGRLEKTWQLKCPSCGSGEVKYKGEARRKLSFTEAIVSLLHIPVRKHLLVYACSDCGSTFNVK